MFPKGRNRRKISALTEKEMVLPMKKFFLFFLALTLLFPLSSCQRSGEPRTQTAFLMDTFLTITLYPQGKVDPDLFAGAFALARDIEDKTSRTKEGSEIYAFNQAEASYTFSEEVADLIARTLVLSEATDGAYDITTAPLTDLWNIKNGGPVPTEEALNEALSHVGWQKLSLTGNTLTKTDPAVKIDLGSASKGYALGKICGWLKAQGALALVNFGGSIGFSGEKTGGDPWRVSIRSPFFPDKSAGSFALTEGYVAVSGHYERYFEENGQRYHHLLSPFNGYPIRGIASAAVTAPDAADADMLSTALFVLGIDCPEKAEKLAKTYNATYLLIEDDINYTPLIGGKEPERFTPAERTTE